MSDKSDKKSRISSNFIVGTTQEPPKLNFYNNSGVLIYSFDIEDVEAFLVAIFPLVKKPLMDGMKLAREVFENNHCERCGKQFNRHDDDSEDDFMCNACLTELEQREL